MRALVQWVRRGGLGLATVVAVAAAGVSTVRAACVADCNGDGEVTVNELIKMVNISLELAPVTDCSVGDANNDGAITVNEIIAGVNNSLNGCPATGVCGDAVVASGEECDNGGICIGGDNAGTACTAESQCQGEGVCVGGAKEYAVCGSDTDCPGSKCVHCRTFGGDGCAANCTTESAVTVTLKPGELNEDQTDLVSGTTGYVIHSDTIPTFPLPLPANSSQILTLGKAKDTQIPVVIKVGDLRFPTVPVQTLACFCIRGVDFRTCGGTLTNRDGSLSADCSPELTAGDTVCTGKKHCAAVYGPGNTAEGVVGCQELAGVNLTTTQDSGGSGPSQSPVLTFSGTGGPGSAVLRNAVAQGYVIGSCTGTGGPYGPDGTFCTDDDPTSARGSAAPGVLVTGTASATITGTNGSDDPASTLGPFDVTGVPLSCSELAGGDGKTGTLVTAFTQLDVETLGDAAFVGSFVAK